MMNNTISYQAAAHAYTDGVQVLFAPSGVSTGDRGGQGPVSLTDLAEQAEKLTPLSAALTQAATALLADDDPRVRAEISTRLLAKTLTDLEVSAYLLKAAKAEEAQLDWYKGKGEDRGAPSRASIEDCLHVLGGEIRFTTAPPERGGNASPSDIPTARQELSSSVKAALTLILERAGKTGQSALNGLLGLGVTELAKAAGVVGMDIATALGQAQKVTRLYNAFRGFAIQAYNSLLALLGNELAQMAAKQVLEWVNDLRKGKLFSELLEELYATKPTDEMLTKLVTDSQVDLARFALAITDVNTLNENYRQQTDLVDKLLTGLSLLSSVPAMALPQGRLLVAAAYLLLGGYVVLAGADYVDAERLKLLNRVPGVRQVVQINLGV